ncbi:hypothetical protein CPB84DRAFT_1749580 [Gymnopilus junonius]|uniref:Uncharacterized protein n=1 Tax=Gymnopilus junonius TaxID=109634 RepID=A0A9P5NJ38_GYMJU|nr:hypothetical protein CPB84DRAFT_1749580 [Gymnopilus junonius]
MGDKHDASCLPTFVFPPYEQFKRNLDLQLHNARVPASSPIHPPPSRATLSLAPQAPACQPEGITATTTARGSKSAVILELQSLKQCMQQLEEDNESLMEKVSKLENDTRKEKKHIMQEMNDLHRMVAELQHESENLAAKVEVTSGSLNASDREDIKPIIDKEVAKKMEKSHQATNSNALLWDVFAKAMACLKKLTGNLLPEYPKEGKEWPLRTGSEDKALRFKWDKPSSDETNWPNLQIIIKEICTNGSSYSHAVTSLLTELLDDNLQEHVIWKYKELVKARAGHLKGKAKPVITALIAISSSPDPDKALEGDSKAVLSEALTKLDVCQCKHNNLPPAHELCNKKYDAAMVHMLMSDDEDSYKDGTLVMMEYVSHAPVYQSEELCKFYTAIDGLTDPNPSNNPLPITKKLENCVHHWMISTEWLQDAKNKIYDILSQITESGKAWGDPEDPEAIEAKQK